MKADPDRKEFAYCSAVLDIDLDYFSCAGNPSYLEEIVVEITKTEYNSFIENRYHRLNYIGVGRIDVIEKEGKYFYVFNNYKELYPDKVKVDKNNKNKL